MSKYPHIGSCSILVVDDEEELCEMIADEFRRTGANVETAYDGQSAVSKAQKSKCRIVFTDLRMPNGDGAYLARELRRIEPHPPLVFFYTGNSDYSEEELSDLGVGRSFKKPRNLSEVMGEIEEILARKMG